MAGRALSSFFVLALLAAGSSSARAENETIAVGEPSPGQQQQAEAPARPLPKLLGFGKGEDGTHVFLFGREGAPPVVFIGQPGDLKELEVLGIERGKGKFMVDTLEIGDIVFNTTEKSVIIPGEIGFNSKRPTRVMKGTPDKAVFVEALARMGYVRRAASPAQTLPSALGKVVARGRQLASGTHTGGRVGVFNKATRSGTSMRARLPRRPPGRAGVAGRPVMRASAKVRAR